jgi:hypothetical protein
MSIRTSLLLALSLSLTLLTARGARAETPEAPKSVTLGRYLIEVNPLGLELLFAPPAGLELFLDAKGSHAVYSLGLTFAGKVAERSRISVWLGGELDIGGIANFARIEPGLFLELTFEKWVPIRLVPFFRAGFIGSVDVIYGLLGDFAGGGIAFKCGGGAYYFITRHIGVGLETNIALGGHFQNFDGVSDNGFLGYWDLRAGGAFTF